MFFLFNTKHFLRLIRNHSVSSEFAFNASDWTGNVNIKNTTYIFNLLIGYLLVGKLNSNSVLVKFSYDFLIRLLTKTFEHIFD